MTSLDAVILQESQFSNESQLKNKCQLPGYFLAATIYHASYNTSICVKINVELVHKTKRYVESNHQINLQLRD